MSRQIIVIGGGTSFKTYDDYLSYLKNKSVDLDKFRKPNDWKDNLKEDLEEKYDVLYLSMPNNRNAKYEEWKIWFEKTLKLLDKKIILMGHSLGGIFLARYLSEYKTNKEIVATILVAAPFKNEFENEDLRRFALPKSLGLFSKQSRVIFLLHSKDDPVVPFSHVEYYKKQLPKAKIRVFNKNGHFKQAHFPEIVKLIQDLN